MFCCRMSSNLKIPSPLSFGYASSTANQLCWSMVDGGAARAFELTPFLRIRSEVT